MASLQQTLNTLDYKCWYYETALKAGTTDVLQNMPIEEIQNKLEQCHDTGKDPNPMAQGMSWMKTNVKLAMDESDATIADLITDGCNMGVKSLSRYLNQYQAADEETKDIAKKLIKQEEELSIHMRSFL